MSVWIILNLWFIFMFRLIYAVVRIILIDKKIYYEFIRLSTTQKDTKKLTILWAMTIAYYQSDASIIKFVLDLTAWREKDFCMNKKVYQELFEMGVNLDEE